MRRKPSLINAFLVVSGVMTFINNGTSTSLLLEATKVTSGPIYAGKTAYIQANITHQTPAMDNTTEVVLLFTLPSYFKYEQFTSNGSRPPNNVTVTRADKFLSLTMKFNKLLITEYVAVQAAFQLDPSNNFHDDLFHHAPCKVSLRYQGHDQRSCESTNHDDVMTEIPFYSPGCEGFGSVGLSSGEVKNSQIAASSSRKETFLSYSGRIGDSFTGWIPKKRSKKEFHTLHFFQVDLKLVAGIKMAAIHGVAREIPLEKIFLVTSEDGLEWKQRRHAIETAVDRIDSDTVMVMKSLKYEAFARFVRIVLPPFDKRMKVGEEMPGYKVELFRCLNTGSVWHGNTVPSPTGLGIESGAIPDSQFTSTSQLSLEYGAQFSRLNSRTGGGAWCAASCDPSVYLQIDLGRVLLIRELDVQSKHDDSGGTNTVLSFFLENSADGVSWEYYKANGANKLFLGSTLRNLAIRHKLLIPVNARFVRFRPKTCINQACMRAELYFYPDFVGQDVPVVFGRSFLLKATTSTLIVCKSEVRRSERHCKSTSDGGGTWKELPRNVLNVIAYDPVGDTHYGVATNKKTFLRNKRSPFMEWIAISNNIWSKVKDSPTLVTATEVPFMPVLETAVKDPYDALTLPVSIAFMRKRRSAASNDMWGSSSRDVLFKASGATTWKTILSWIDYPYDMKVGCLGLPCESGTCEVTPDGGYKCKCFPGFKGRHCFGGIHIKECNSNPCKNGAQCEDEVNGFSCACLPGFTGNQCEIDIDECANNPCLGGVCNDHINNYTCICIPGKTGKHCEFDTTCMVSNPCLNGGMCDATYGGGYTCQCDVLFAGVHCQLAPFNCWRSTISSDYQSWPITDKFDKIAFTLSADHYVLGVRVGSTFPERVDVTVTIKITHSDGVLIVTKTVQRRFPDWTSDPIYFDQAVLLSGGQQYIAASLVEAPYYVSLRKYEEGESTVQCSGLIVTFSTVSYAEFADSNGSNVLEGRVPALILRSP